MVRGFLLAARRHSTFHRERFARAGIEELADEPALRRLPPMGLDDVVAISSVVPWVPGSGLTSAARPGRPGRRSRRVAHRYRPLLWLQAEGVPLAYAKADLDLLSLAGAAALGLAGIGPHDLVASLAPLPFVREREQLRRGAERVGTMVHELGPSPSLADLARLRPTVLVGTADELVRIIEGVRTVDPGLLERVHTAIVLGPEPEYPQRKLLVEHLRSASALVRWWAPPGVMASWPQCRGGSAFHLFPELDLVEVVDPLTDLPAAPEVTGSLLWTGIGWFATTMVRLRTQAAGLVRTDPCTSCGRTTPRVEVVEHGPLGFPAVLDGIEAVAAWYAELQRHGDDDGLVVWLALADQHASLGVLQEVDRHIGAAEVHLVDVAEVERRIEAARGERFGDRRAFPAPG